MKEDDRRRGTILVTILWCVVLLSALAMAASTTFRGFAGVMAVDRDRIQAEALLTGGLEAASSIIANASDMPFTNFETLIALQIGTARITISDEGGRIDIGRAPIELLAGLFQSAGASQRQASDFSQQIVDWRDRWAKGGDGDVLFTDIRQLSQIPGLSAEWIAAIAPLATVYSNEKVNPLTASEGVIAALPGVDDASRQAFLAMRRNFPRDAARLVAFLGPAQRYLEVKPQQVFSVKLEARLADGFGSVARTTIVLLPEDTQPYRVLVWNPLPNP
jgi:general secretion pathway protein K